MHLNLYKNFPPHRYFLIHTPRSNRKAERCLYNTWTIHWMARITDLHMKREHVASAWGKEQTSLIFYYYYLQTVIKARIIKAVTLHLHYIHSSRPIWTVLNLLRHVQGRIRYWLHLCHVSSGVQYKYPPPFTINHLLNSSPLILNTSKVRTIFPSLLSVLDLFCVRFIYKLQPTEKQEE